MTLKYNRGASTNHIYYPNSSIPINHANIQDKETLDKLDGELFHKSIMFFHKELNEETCFNLSYLISIHRRTLETLYPFAGKFRDVNLSKGNTTFCLANNLKTMSGEIFSKLESENYLRNFEEKSREDFAGRLAYYSCELIALHPFDEFNGRTIRLFFDMIVTYNGYNYIDYQDSLTSSDEGVNKYIQASEDCVCRTDASILYYIILNGLSKA